MGEGRGEAGVRCGEQQHLAGVRPPVPSSQGSVVPAEGRRQAGGESGAGARQGNVSAANQMQDHYTAAGGSLNCRVIRIRRSAPYVGEHA